MIKMQEKGPGLADLDAVEQTLMILARENADGGVDCQEVLNNITTMLKEVFEPTIRRTHKYLQDEIDAQLKTYKGCKETLLSETTGFETGALNTTKEAIDSCHDALDSRSGMLESRSCAEDDFIENKEAAEGHLACEELEAMKTLAQDYATGESCKYSSTSTASLRAYLLERKNHFQTSHAKALSLTANCSQASTEEIGHKAVCHLYKTRVDEQKDLCEDKQKDFEIESCKRSMHFHSACKAYKLCYKDTVRDKYCPSRQTARTQEEELQAEWTKVQRLFCTIEMTGAGTPATHCPDLPVDTTWLKLKYFVLRPMEECVQHEVPCGFNKSAVYDHLSSKHDKLLHPCQECTLE
jgi:hypothetical protein